MTVIYTIWQVDDSLHILPAVIVYRGCIKSRVLSLNYIRNALLREIFRLLLHPVYSKLFTVYFSFIYILTYIKSYSHMRAFR